MRNPKFLGVYSLKTATSSGRRPKFFIWSLPDGSYAAQELDASMSPRGAARAIPAGGLERAFRAEPSNLAAPVTTPDFRKLVPPRPARQQAPAPAQKAPSLEQSLAEAELARRVRQLEMTLRDSFDKALRALGRPRDRKGALAAIERIVGAEEGIVPEHKHMFRDFGVCLRKRKLYDLALASARRAVELSPRDDHARFNLARLLELSGKLDEAQAQLDSARKIDPQEKIYDRMARYLRRQRVGNNEDDEDDK